MDETSLLPPGSIQPPVPLPPGVTAQGIGLRRGSGWVLREVTANFPLGSVVAVSGPIGSGHTSAILGLCGRFELDEGTVEVAGGLGMIGWFSDLDMLDAELTVMDTTLECAEAVDADEIAIPAMLAWAELTQRSDTAVKDLLAEERVMLGLVWAALSEAPVVGIEATCVTHTLSPVWRAARNLAEQGRLVIVGTALAVVPAEVNLSIPWGLPV
jgi:ATPase subunit of ABC transporter with duplicated ATPase domains